MHKEITFVILLIILYLYKIIIIFNIILNIT